MPRIEDLTTDILGMSYEERLEHIRRIREGRVMPAPKTATKTAKRSQRKQKKLSDMIEDMSAEERLALLKKLGVSK